MADEERFDADAAQGAREEESRSARNPASDGDANEFGVISTRSVALSSYRRRLQREFREENLFNRIARVFISSTFADMQNERNCLWKTVFPKIQKFCRERSVEFAPVDLRWGITDEESKSGLSVELCLKKIDRSRPFFIGILGERYGWKPTREQVQPSTIFQFPIVEAALDARASMTELEIAHALFQNDDAFDAAVWFRDRKESLALGAADPDESDDARKLAKLKRDLRASESFKIYDYASLEEFAEQTEEALKRWVVKNFHERRLSWLEERNLEQNAFARARTRFYVPQQEDFDALDAFLESTDPVAALVAPSGWGKSALIANWAKNAQDRENSNRRPNLTVLVHHVGAGDFSTEIADVVKRIVASLTPDAISERRLRDEEALEMRPTDDDGGILRVSRYDPNAFRNALLEWRKSHPKQRLLVVLDGLDHMRERADERNDSFAADLADSAQEELNSLSWIPDPTDGVKFLLASSETDELRDAVARRRWKTIALDSLSPSRRAEMIVGALAYYGRELSDARVDALASVDAYKNPLALRALVDELCVVVEKHEDLEDALRPWLDVRNARELFDRIFARLEREGEEWRLGRAQNPVPLVVATLAASRCGLTERELVAALGAEVSPLAVEATLASLDARLTRRNGVYAFADDYSKEAAFARWSAETVAARRRLANFYADSNHVGRRFQEVPWQLARLEDWDALERFLLDFELLRKFYDDARPDSEFCRYWRALLAQNRAPGEERYSVAHYYDLPTTAETFCKYGVCVKDVAQRFGVYSEEKTIAWMKRAGASGDADALIALGVKYASQGDLSSAIEAFKEGAALGSADAMRRLGQCWDRGGNPEEAFAWYEKGASAGDPDAMFLLGRCYFKGVGAPENERKGVEWWIRAAELDVADAARMVARCFEDGRGVEQDLTQAIEWHKKAGELGVVESVLRVAEYFEDGEGGDVDMEEAAEWYRKAAALGNVRAVCWLHYVYEDEEEDEEGSEVVEEEDEEGSEVVEEEDEEDSYDEEEEEDDDSYDDEEEDDEDSYDDEEEENEEDEEDLQEFLERFRSLGAKEASSRIPETLRRGAEFGMPDAMFRLGICYETGQGVEKDAALAFQWYRRAAELGDSDAMFKLGACYEDGEGTTKDLEQALVWKRRSAEAGNPRGMCALGRAMQKGEGTEKDAAQAIKWYRQAAELGEPFAWALLGNCSILGEGVARNPTKAGEYFQKGAELGNSVAMKFLAMRFLLGDGVPQDPAKGEEWFKKSVEARYKERDAENEKVREIVERIRDLLGGE